jgi:hypothetical protein
VLSKRDANGTPGGGGLSAKGVARLRMLLLLATVVSAWAIYEVGRCSGPLAGRPVFGMFTIHCEWRDRTVRSLRVCEYLTAGRARFDPLTRALIYHMALRAAKRQLDRLGPIESRAEIDALVLGRVLPCRLAICATHFSNPTVMNLRPRLFTGNPPVDIGPACGD